MAIAYSDRDVEQNALDALLHDVRIDASNVSVTVKDGVVHLTGTVPSYTEKVTAEEDVARIKGVRGVQNDLKVSRVRLFTDEEIADGVRRGLDRDVRIVNPDTISVAVTNGVVSLSGTVPNARLRIAAEEDAWNVPGVADVMNDIAVAPPTPPRTDADIAADVRKALVTDPHVNPSNIEVRVTGGTVYLNGTVPNYYQIREASDDAWTVPGVVNVVNNLTVAA
jgi:osmotically-inducible protein OsmY